MRLAIKVIYLLRKQLQRQPLAVSGSGGGAAGGGGADASQTVFHEIGQV